MFSFLFLENDVKLILDVVSKIPVVILQKGELYSMNNKDLTLEELEYVQKEVQINTKNMFVAYLLAIFLGSLGLHRAYFGKRNTAIIKAVLSIITAIVVAYVFVSTGIATIQADQLTGAVLAQYATLATVILFLGGVNFIWSLIDLFLIPKWKRVHDELNRKKAHEEMIVARYTYEQLLRERVSEAVLEKVQKEVLDKIQEKMDQVVFEANLEPAELPQFSEEVLVQDEVDIGISETEENIDKVDSSEDKLEK